MIEKVGVYCRLSDEDRTKVNKNDDSDSIVNQRSMCLKYASQNGWNVVDIYSDDDFSGAGVERPDFNRLIDDCKNGKINLVLCKSQSRFSRDMEVIERYLHNKFIEWGVRFISIVDNADTNDVYNKKSRQINGLMNEWYLDDLSNNIKKTLKNRREEGLYMGSFAFYGYKRDPNDKHKLIIDPIAAEIVKKIFELYVSGYGYHKICKYLNENNIPTRAQYKKINGSKFVSGKCNYDKVKWTGDSIAQILKNEIYIGNLVQGKITSLGYKIHKTRNVPKKDWCRVENTHEPIIDLNTWNKVQTRLGSHINPIKNGEIHYLSRKIYCKKCKKVFQRNVCNVKEEKSGKRSYHQCAGYRRFHVCDNKYSIRTDELEKIIITEINKLLDNYYDQNNLQDLYNENKLQNTTLLKIESINKELKNIEKTISDNRNYYKTLFEDKTKGLIDEKMFKMMSNDYAKVIEDMTKRKETLNKEIEKLNLKQTQKQKADNILKKYNHIDSLNKFIIDEFIENIYIGSYDTQNKTRDIEIVWNLEF